MRAAVCREPRDFTDVVAGSQDLQHGAGGRRIDRVARQVEGRIEHALAAHRCRGVDKDQVRPVRPRTRQSIGIGPQRLGKSEGEQGQESDTQGQQDEVPELLAHVNLLLCRFEQHGRTEGLAIRTLRLQPVQPERHRDCECANEE